MHLKNYLDRQIQTEAIDFVDTGKDDKFDMDPKQLGTKKRPEGKVIARFDEYELLLSGPNSVWGDDSILIMHGKHAAGLIGLTENYLALAAMDKRLLQISTSVISKKYEGKGLMYRAYVALVQAGYDLLSDTAQTTGGQKLWSRLAQTKGVFVYAVDFGLSNYAYNRGDKRDQRVDFYAVDPDDITDGSITVYLNSSTQEEIRELERQIYGLEDAVKHLDDQLFQIKRSDPRYKGLVDERLMYKTELKKARADHKKLEATVEKGERVNVRLMATRSRRKATPVTESRTPSEPAYELELIRSRDEDVLKVTSNKTDKWIEIRGKPNYETHGHDENDPLHKFLDKLDPATVAALMAGDVKYLNPNNSRTTPSIDQTRAVWNEPSVAESTTGKAYGYKAMNYNPETGEIVSGADSRVTQGLKLSKGMTVRMPGRGIFMSTNRDYVLQYYSGHNDHEVLIKFEFDPSTITSGNLTDRESEFTVPRARVVDFEILNNLDEAIETVPTGKNHKFGVKFATIKRSGKVVGRIDGLEVLYTGDIGFSDIQQAPGFIVWDPVDNVAAGVLMVKSNWEAADLHKKTVPVSVTAVNEKYEGRGLMLKLYVLLVRKGFALLSDDMQTAGGQKTWARLAKVPGVTVYAVDMSDRKNPQYSAVDPDDITDANFRVYQDDDNQMDKLNTESKQLYMQRLDLKDQIDHEQEKIKNDEVDASPSKVRDLNDQLKVIERELAAINAEFESWKKHSKTGKITKLMAVADKKAVTESDTQEIQKPDPKDTLGVKRQDMPQVHRSHYPELLKYLRSHGGRVRNSEVHARELKAVQSEFSDAGVRKMMSTSGRPTDSVDKKPLIVSSDNYIIDGHHRWLAAWNQDESVPIMQVSLPVRRLLQLIREFPHTTYKDIHEERDPMEQACLEGGHVYERPLDEIRIIPPLKNDGPNIGRADTKLQMVRDNHYTKIRDVGGNTLYMSNELAKGEDVGYVMVTTADLSMMIGYLQMVRRPLPAIESNTYKAGMAWVNPKYRRQGWATVMYEAMLAKGYNITADMDQTKFSQKVWTSLVNKHKAYLVRDSEVVEPMNDQLLALAYRQNAAYNYTILIAAPGTKVMENISITGTERHKSERSKKLVPGTDAWFRHWFSKPYLKRDDVDRLKEEAVNYIKTHKGVRHEKKVRHG